MYKAHVLVKTMAAAKHARHPWDDLVITTGRVKVLFNVWFAGCLGDLILHFLDERGD